ncbi:MAG TPA: NAD(P)H-dependent oxidoreductase [Polyangia bacterium]|nr:NAD(P)H-dependent oxidoreductase [Polyangia bacterium]
MLKLLVVVASTREERVGHLVADWAVGQVRAHGKFQSELADLKAIDLPLLDEPNHPRLGQYKHAHTKAWSATVSAADAFLFVTPEYNFAMAPAMLNALDYLFREWAYKPAAFVSYGGMSGGTRSVQSAKPVLTSLKIMPLPEAVAIPFVTKFVKDGRFEGDENQAKSAVAMLDELHKWAAALAPLRAPAS